MNKPVRRVPRNKKRNPLDVEGFGIELEAMRRSADNWRHPKTGKKMSRKQRQDYFLSGEFPG